MNPISAFLVQHLIFVYFLYGLAFFVMGLALLLVRRRNPSFPLAVALGPLTVFALLHGIHEWYEMFQLIETQIHGAPSPLWAEGVRLALLVLSFGALVLFGTTPGANIRGPWPHHLPLGALLALWLLGGVAVYWVQQPAPADLLALLDVLARYCLGLPGALLGAWVLMQQQHTLREQNLGEFGRDLVWCAAALLLYGLVGQLFVRPTALPPSTVLNSVTFLAWFGVPVQLFRALLAGGCTLFLIKALRVFDVESQRRLEEANQSRLAAQSQVLAAERRSVAEISRLNDELRLSTRELSLLLELSNILVTPQALAARLTTILERIVDNLHFTDAGLIVLVDHKVDAMANTAQTGFLDLTDDGRSRYSLTLALGRRSIAEGRALCAHADSQVLEIQVEVDLLKQACAQYLSPTLYIALPIYAQQQVIGSLALARTKGSTQRLTNDELRLITGIVQQLGLSLENARLYQEAQLREKMLSELLDQVVGAQEAERQRIARELHDATGQSLTAIALGLRGIEGLTAAGKAVPAQQIHEIVTFATGALGELRQLIADLRPSQLDDLGLVAALQWYAQEYERRHGQSVAFAVNGQPARLSAEYETVIFRIAQEALTNIAKHARATQVTVTVAYQPGRIAVTVADNGRGFDPATLTARNGQRPGWGLLGIRERALLLGGSCDIHSAPGAGCCIRVEIPLLLEEVACSDG
jgi:signal transduction histidine kinase